MFLLQIIKIEETALKVMGLSDFHGNQSAASAAAERILAEGPSMILVAGDISDGAFASAAKLLAILGNLEVPTLFVPGNWDSPRLYGWSGRFVKNLHGACESVEGYVIAGVGGSVQTPFKTPFELDEQDVSQILIQAVSGCVSGRLILLSHCPPRGTKLDKTKSGIHAGSWSVRQFIESRRPVLVVSGHVHEAQGIDNLGSTVIVNPGPAYDGNYAKIELHDKVQVTLSKFEV